MVIWVLIGVSGWIVITLIAIAMCRLAALGDSTLVFDESPPRPVPDTADTAPAGASRRPRRALASRAPIRGA
jgi:hypothetical protein